MLQRSTNLKLVKSALKWHHESSPWGGACTACLHFALRHHAAREHQHRVRRRAAAALLPQKLHQRLGFAAHLQARGFQVSYANIEGFAAAALLAQELRQRLGLAAHLHHSSE